MSQSGFRTNHSADFCLAQLIDFVLAGTCLCADDTCIFYHHENINKVENVLDKEFSSLFQWLIDNHEQDETVEDLGCQLDPRLSGEAMASKLLKKINVKLKFLYRQSRCLFPAHKRLSSNALIQSHFDFEFSLWLPVLNKNLKLKLQKVQNKCIRFCSNLPLKSLSNHSTLEK